MSLITTKAMNIGYGKAPILTGVNFTISPKEIVTIVGPNGSGKSSFLRALIGAIKPMSGSVERQSGLGIGYVPQRLSVDRTMPITVRRFLSLPRAVSEADAKTVLARVGAPGLEQRQLASLSGGQFQRVLVARAILSKPDILMLDEPAQGLDQPGEAAFYQLIQRLRDELGSAVLLVSHDLHVVMSASDRVICLNGHICCEGAPNIVSEAPEYRALFGIGTGGALALYQHDHDHHHDHDHDHHDHEGAH